MSYDKMNFDTAKNHAEKRGYYLSRETHNGKTRYHITSNFSDFIDRRGTHYSSIASAMHEMDKWLVHTKGRVIMKDINVNGFPNVNIWLEPRCLTSNSFTNKTKGYLVYNDEKIPIDYVWITEDGGCIVSTPLRCYNIGDKSAPYELFVWAYINAKNVQAITADQL